MKSYAEEQALLTLSEINKTKSYKIKPLTRGEWIDIVTKVIKKAEDKGRYEGYQDGYGAALEAKRFSRDEMFLRKDT